MTEETYRKASELKARIKEIKIERDLLQKLKSKNTFLEIREVGNESCKDSFITDSKTLQWVAIEILDKRFEAQQKELIDEFNRL